MSIVVGQKYWTRAGILSEALWVGLSLCTFRDELGYEFSCKLSDAEKFKAYKEPRSVTFYVNIYENNGELKTGVVWSTKEKATAAAATGNVIDTMEITWTEKVE